MFVIPLTALTFLRQGAMQAIGRVVTGQMPEYIIRPIVTVAVVVTLALIGPGALTATTAVAANLAGVATAFAVGALMLMRALPRIVRTVAPRYATRVWLRSALPMMLVSGVWLINNYCTTLVVGSLAGSRAVGTYSVVEKGAELIVVLLVAANLPLAPVIARAYAQKDLETLQHSAERVAQATLLVSLPVAIAFAFFPTVYLNIFGPTFQAGATALTILALAQLVNAAAGPAGNVLLMTGHERAAVWGIGSAMAVNVVVAVALVPPLGVTGGAIASASSLVIWNVVLLLLARKLVGVNVTAFRALHIAHRANPGDRRVGLATAQGTSGVGTLLTRKVATRQDGKKRSRKRQPARTE
jgi:O-antigen/teichoic acid export membrane protein